MHLPVVDLIGFAASALVFLTFCMRTLLPLRLVAIGSNLFFILYGLTAGLMPILVLHLLLLPMNIWRTAQQLQVRKRMRAVLLKTPNLEALLPFMTTQRYDDGAVVFHRGAAADRIYVVAKGQVVVEGIDNTLTQGAVFGEMAFFNDDGKRTATVRARGPVTLSCLDHDTILRTFLDNPDFALFLTRLMVIRLTRTEEAHVNAG